MKSIEFKKIQRADFGWSWPQTTREIWQIDGKSFQVLVTKGKPLDAIKLKNFDSEKFRKKTKTFKKQRLKFFRNSANLKKVRSCYFCKTPTKKNSILVQIYQSFYVQCPKCGLVFLKKRLKEKILKNLYQKNKEYASTYTDKRTLKIRINQVVLPKIDWMEKIYKESYGRKPKTILDVGAGAGHFVWACRRKGYLAEGIEINENCCSFAKENFGIKLKREDFLKFSPRQKFDVITFWGVIEHLVNPMDFVKKAKELLDDRGMIIIQGPNFYSFSTAIQKYFNQSVVRHLDPLSHLMVFTESALCYLLLNFGLTPKAIWYLGMDVYEFFCQLSNSGYEVLPKLNSAIEDLQKIIDLKELSDSIILAATN